MIQERVFDSASVRSEESREIGEASDSIVDIAGFEKGEHCVVVVLDVLDSCQMESRRKTFQFFPRMRKSSSPTGGMSIFLSP